MSFRTIPLLLVLLGAARLAAAQPFVEQQPEITPAVWSTLALGDVDRDGDLDVLVIGVEPHQSAARLYLNDGRDGDGRIRFSDAGADLSWLDGFLTSFPNRLRAPSAAWGDFDGDGDLDLLVGDSERVGIYRQDEVLTFTPVYTDTRALANREALMPEGLNTSSLAWGDYDGDGDLDALVARQRGTYVLRNHDGQFVQREVGLPALANAAVSWGDFDGDGDLDVLAVQRLQGGQSTTTVYRLTNGRYEALPFDLPAYEQGAATWADYDGDGDLDVLITGGAIGAPTVPGGRVPGNTLLFRNDAGTLVRTADALPPSWYGSWFDGDGDGDLDLLLLSGDAANNTALRIVSNDAGRFTETMAALPGVWLGAAATGDLDGDARPALLVTGQVRTGLTRTPATLLFTRTDTGRTLNPVVPAALRSSRAGDTYTFEWSVPVDSLPAGLTFNVRLGTSPEAGDVVAPHVLPTGRRLIAAPGNAGRAQRLSVRGLDTTATYYWSVQAVTAGRTGFAFAPEQVVRPDAAPSAPRPRRLPDIIDNFPNPFNPSTTIRFVLESPSDVRIVVYDVLGGAVTLLHHGPIDAGTHEVVWDGHDRTGRAVPSGLYYCALEMEGRRVTHSMLLVK